VSVTKRGRRAEVSFIVAKACLERLSEVFGEGKLAEHALIVDTDD
jgi:hypothetical protein